MPLTSSSKMGRRDAHPALTASLVLTYAQGLWRMALIDYDRARFAREIDAFLKVLGLPRRVTGADGNDSRVSETV
jgi:hypothetical protein